MITSRYPRCTTTCVWTSIGTAWPRTVGSLRVVPTQPAAGFCHCVSGGYVCHTRRRRSPSSAPGLRLPGVRAFPRPRPRGFRAIMFATADQGTTIVAYDGIRSYRPVIMGRRGAVASNHPLATQAGLLALQAGGDAVDAAVAIGATLGVVEPFMSGLGGDGFYHVYRKATGEAVVFNGTGAAPAAATPERYSAGIPISGPLAFSTPGTVGGWGAMHARYSRTPWAGLF